jgi:hypothetical protein
MPWKGDNRMRKIILLCVLALMTISCDEPTQSDYVESKEIYKNHYIIRTETPICCNNTVDIMYVEVSKEDWDNFHIKDRIRLNGRNRNHFKEDLFPE